LGVVRVELDADDLGGWESRCHVCDRKADVRAEVQDRLGLAWIPSSFRKVEHPDQHLLHHDNVASSRSYVDIVPI